MSDANLQTRSTSNGCFKVNGSDQFECNLFVSGIPIDLESHGLKNLFAKAGLVEAATIKPPKEPRHTTTFGFVRFKQRSAAAQAIEMFDGFMMGSNRLQVKYARSLQNDNNNNNNNGGGGLLQPTLVDSKDWDEEDRQIAAAAKRRQEDERASQTSDVQMETTSGRSRGRGRVISSNVSEASNDSHSRANSTSRRGSSKSLAAWIEGMYEKIKIGETYEAKISRSWNPSKFEIEFFDPQIIGSSRVRLCGKCKMNIRPPNGETEWCQEVCDALDRLKGTLCMARIEDRAGSKDAPQDYIYTVDLLFAGEESLVDYFLNNELADKVELSREDRLIESVKLLNGNEKIITKTTTTTTMTTKTVKREEEQQIAHDDVNRSAKRPNNQKEDDKVKQSETNSNKKLNTSTSSDHHNHNQSKSSESSSAKFAALVSLEKVVFQYAEEDGDYFYVARKSQMEKLDLLQAKLQESSPEVERILTYITSFGSLQLGEYIEALYDQDEKWYRVKVTSIDSTARCVHVYFGDFGNMARIDEAELKKRPMLRRRHWEMSQDRDLFELDFQAIRCYYLSPQQGKRPLGEFLEKLASIDSENGFDLKVYETKEDEKHPSVVVYGVDLDNNSSKSHAGSTTSATDHEVRQIFESASKTMQDQQPRCADMPREVVEVQQPTRTRVPHTPAPASMIKSSRYSAFSMKTLFPNEPQLRSSTSDATQTVVAVLVDSLDEFYVQIVDEQSEKFAELDLMMRRFCANLNKKKLAKCTYQVGDLVYAKFVDMEWYRAVVVSIEHGTAAQANLLNTTATDDLDETFESSVFMSAAGASTSYEVYFIDYGNKHTILSHIEICSIEMLLEHISALSDDVNPSELEMAKQAVSMHAQAHRCSLTDSIARTPGNLELMQNAYALNSFFDVDRLVDVEKCPLIEDGQKAHERIDVFKYKISLKQDGKLVEEMLEKSKTIVSNPAPSKSLEKPQVTLVAQNKPFKNACFNSDKLKSGLLYLCRLAHLELETGEIFVNLIDEFPKLEELEASLRTEWKSEAASSGSKFKVGDLVLAKYYSDQDADQFNWYRAIVTRSTPDAASKFDVMYLDYGNCDRNVSGSHLVKLPERFGLDVYSPPLAYKIRLANNIKLNIDDHGTLIEQFLLTVDSFGIEVVLPDRLPSSSSSSSSFTSLDINHNKLTDAQEKQQNEFDFFTYDVLLWDKRHVQCLNHLIRPATKVNLAPTPTPKTSKINKSSISVLLESATKNNESRILPSHLVFDDDLDKPIYFCLESDTDKQVDLMNELNSFYTSPQQTASKKFSITRLAEIKCDSYLAALSEGNWYRVRVKSVGADQIHVFFVDFGYQDYVKESEFGERLRVLDDKFTQGEYKLAFGALLADNNRPSSLIDIKELDEKIMLDVVENFFEQVIDNREFSVKIIKKLESNEIQNKEWYLPGEEYYSIELRNQKNACLNDMLVAERDKNKAAKISSEPRTVPKPVAAIRRLKLTDMPGQKSLTELQDNNDQFLVFSRSIDLFYVFSATNVNTIQPIVQDICQEIIKELESNPKLLENDAASLPQVGDLVYGLYELDDSWYRCLVTNCNDERTNYELFYIDFGNTELASREHILVPRSDRQTRPLLDYEPQAYKCNLYGVCSRDNNERNVEDASSARKSSFKSAFSESANEEFKNVLSNKVFSVQFLDETAGQESDGQLQHQQRVYHVSLNEIVSDSKSTFASGHKYVVKQKIGAMFGLDKIIEMIKTPQQMEFFFELVRSFKS